MKTNPNAVAGGVSGIGGGVLVVYLFSLFGVDLDAMAAAAIAGALSATVLFIGRNGLRGALRIVWRGKG